MFLHNLLTSQHEMHLKKFGYEHYEPYFITHGLYYVLDYYVLDTTCSWMSS